MGKIKHTTNLIPNNPREPLHGPLTREDQPSIFPPNTLIQPSREKQVPHGAQVLLVEAVLEHGDEGGVVAMGGEVLVVAVVRGGSGL